MKEETVKGFHGTRNLEEVLEVGKLFCYTMIPIDLRPEWAIAAERIYQKQLEDYGGLVKEITEICKGTIALEENQEDKEHWSDEELADLGFNYLQNHTKQTEYKELKRRLFVFLTPAYETAVSHITSDLGRTQDRGVFQFSIPRGLLRKGLSEREDGIFLVPKEIDLKYATAVYASDDRIENVNAVVKKKGLEMGVLPIKYETINRNIRKDSR